MLFRTKNITLTDFVMLSKKIHCQIIKSWQTTTLKKNLEYILLAKIIHTYRDAHLNLSIVFAARFTFFANSASPGDSLRKPGR